MKVCEVDAIIMWVVIIWVSMSMGKYEYGLVLYWIIFLYTIQRSITSLIIFFGGNIYHSKHYNHNHYNHTLIIHFCITYKIICLGYYRKVFSRQIYNLLLLNFFFTTSSSHRTFLRKKDFYDYMFTIKEKKKNSNLNHSSKVQFVRLILLVRSEQEKIIQVEWVWPPLPSPFSSTDNQWGIDLPYM